MQYFDCVKTINKSFWLNLVSMLKIEIITITIRLAFHVAITWNVCISIKNCIKLHLKGYFRQYDRLRAAASSALNSSSHKREHNSFTFSSILLIRFYCYCVLLWDLRRMVRKLVFMLVKLVSNWLEVAATICYGYYLLRMWPEIEKSQMSHRHQRRKKKNAIRNRLNVTIWLFTYITFITFRSHVENDHIVNSAPQKPKSVETQKKQKHFEPTNDRPKQRQWYSSNKRVNYTETSFYEYTLNIFQSILYIYLFLISLVCSDLVSIGFFFSRHYSNRYDKSSITLWNGIWRLANIWIKWCYLIET